MPGPLQFRCYQVNQFSRILLTNYFCWRTTNECVQKWWRMLNQPGCMHHWTNHFKQLIFRFTAFLVRTESVNLFWNRRRLRWFSLRCVQDKKLIMQRFPCNRSGWGIKMRLNTFTLVLSDTSQGLKCMKPNYWRTTGEPNKIKTGQDASSTEGQSNFHSLLTLLTSPSEGRPVTATCSSTCKRN